MDEDTNQTGQRVSREADAGRETKGIPFNKSYPAQLAEPARRALKPMARLMFDTCLQLAWRIDTKGSAKWLGCLRHKGRGPYSCRQLAEAAGTSPPRASNYVKALQKAGLLESTVVDGKRYLRVTDFPARMDGSFYEGFICSWDEGPGKRIAQKAIAPDRDKSGIDCPESNSGTTGSCPESNFQGDVDCLESNSPLTGIAEKAIDDGRAAETAGQRAQGLSGDLGDTSGRDQICTYKNPTETDSSSSDAAGDCVASAADDEESHPVGRVESPAAATGCARPRDSAVGRILREETRRGGAAAEPDILPASPGDVSGEARMRQFLTETMGVTQSRVADLLSAGWSTAQIRHACHFARDRCQRNLGAYLCKCLESPTPVFWREAAEAWEDERERLQQHVTKALRKDCVGYEWRRWVTREILTEDDAYLYGLEGLIEEIAVTGAVNGTAVDFASLRDSMVAMLYGHGIGRADNDVIGGVADYDTAAPATRLLTNFGMPLAKAFLAIVDPAADVSELLDELAPDERDTVLASSVARAPYPDFIDPQWAERLGVETPVGNPDRMADYLWLDPSSDEADTLRQHMAAQRRQRERAEQEAEQREEARRQKQEEEERLRQFTLKPTYDALPDECGTLCEEIGQVLNDDSSLWVLADYGFPIGYEFLEKLFRRHGLGRDDVEHLIIRALNVAYKNDRRDVVEQVIAATVDRAPYPVWFTQHGNSWWRMVMQSQADKWRLRPPTYGRQEMKGYTSLKDLTNQYKVKQPDEPYRETEGPREY